MFTNQCQPDVRVRNPPADARIFSDVAALIDHGAFDHRAAFDHRIRADHRLAYDRARANYHPWRKHTAFHV
jgi:hypothetical protein